MNDTAMTMQPKVVLSDDEIRRFTERSDTRALAVFGNYHLEYPFMAGVPMDRLKALHEHPKERGVYRDTHFPRGDAAVLKAVAC